MVKSNGTNIYGGPTGFQVITTEKAGARLTVVEAIDGAKAKIGFKGKRINIKASNNSRGYVDADKVKSS